MASDLKISHIMGRPSEGSNYCRKTKYCLRQTYASRALALGESLTMIGKLLGHTQVQTTARYAHLARDSIQNAAARITGSIGGNLSSAQSDDEITRQ